MVNGSCVKAETSDILTQTEAASLCRPTRFYCSPRATYARPGYLSFKPHLPCNGTHEIQTALKWMEGRGDVWRTSSYLRPQSHRRHRKSRRCVSSVFGLPTDSMGKGEGGGGMNYRSIIFSLTKDETFFPTSFALSRKFPAASKSNSTVLLPLIDSISM